MALIQIVVLYEKHLDDDCNALQHRLSTNLASFGLVAHARLTCRHWPAQPTYYEMIDFASKQPDGPFMGDIVVLGNA